MAPAGRQSPEQVLAEHEDDVFRHRLCELALTRVGIVYQLKQRLPFDLLFPHMLCGVREIKREGT
jgi:hypothetical protein